MLEIGKRIPEDHRTLILSVLSTSHILDVSDNHTLSFNTAKGLLYGTSIITTENHTLVDELIKKAFEVLDYKTKEMEQAKPALELLKRSYEHLHQSVEPSMKESA